MSKNEKIIAEVTEKATKEAKEQNLNEEQTKLYIETEINKALDEINKKPEKTVIQTQANVNNVPVQQNSNTVPPQVNDIPEKTENTQPVVNENKEVIYIVHTPVKNFCGEVAGVQFAYGQAEVKPGWILKWFKEHGYTVEEVSK
ncbi:MAG: hypothetical protein HFJ48_03765 [Clostridia bacterium]|nr:hypothetical protein [Clostridia bacterium]